MSKTRKVRHAFAGSTRQTRLRVDEGLVPSPDERGMRTRDRSGQMLRDIIDPATGFCTGVTGPMESDGISVRKAKKITGGGAELPERDENTGLWWLGEDRLVVRTVDTPDGPMKVTRLRKPDSEELSSRRNGEKNARLPRVDKPDKSHRKIIKASKATKHRTLPEEYEIYQWVKAFCGVEYKRGTMPKNVRKAAIDAMLAARQRAALG